MTQTDAEERDRFVRANQVHNPSGARRRPRSRRDDDRPRSLGNQRAGIERIVAQDAYRAAGEPLDLLDQVVGEGVVVVDDDDRITGSRRAKDAPGCSW
jgi:hypothetical protein